MAIGPAHVLAVLIGGIHASLYVAMRGEAGGRTLLIVLAAILGAWAGDALGGRLGVDPFRVGDFHVIAASVVAWIGIAFATVLSVLGPTVVPDDR